MKEHNTPPNLRTEARNKIVPNSHAEHIFVGLCGFSCWEYSQNMSPEKDLHCLNRWKIKACKSTLKFSSD